MEIRILKLSDNKGAKDLLSANDILAIHLGYYWMNEKVTFTTDIPIATQPDYVLLTVGNEDEYCYLCRVEDYKPAGEALDEAGKQKFMASSPDKYLDDGNKVWLLFNSIQRLKTDFIDGVLSNDSIKEFIKSRANNKIIG